MNEFNGSSEKEKIKVKSSTKLEYITVRIYFLLIERQDLGPKTAEIIKENAFISYLDILACFMFYHFMLVGYLLFFSSSGLW